MISCSLGSSSEVKRAVSIFLIRVDMSLSYQFKLIEAIRNFFTERNFTDVLTPPLVENPGMEPHIHPMKVSSAINRNELGYLHTSPEFAMKNLLTREEFKNIFTISYCFRDEPDSIHHRNQFLMLEWYRKNERYEKILEDTIDLIEHCFSSLDSDREINFKVMTIEEIFNHYLDCDILELNTIDKISSYIKDNHSDIHVPSEELPWEDYYFLLFLNKIENKLKEYPFLILKEYPEQLKALSTIKESDPRVCERFELYIDGIEIANCYNELTNLKEQKRRFTEQAELKKDLYDYELPEPKQFYKTLENYPKSSGIALGVERLLMAITRKPDQAFFNYIKEL